MTACQFTKPLFFLLLLLSSSWPLTFCSCLTRWSVRCHFSLQTVPGSFCRWKLPPQGGVSLTRPWRRPPFADSDGRERVRVRESLLYSTITSWGSPQICSCSCLFKLAVAVRNRYISAWAFLCICTWTLHSLQTLYCFIRAKVDVGISITEHILKVCSTKLKYFLIL